MYSKVEDLKKLEGKWIVAWKAMKHVPVQIKSIEIETIDGHKVGKAIYRDTNGKEFSVGFAPVSPAVVTYSTKEEAVAAADRASKSP